MRRVRMAVVASHPIQYQAPLFRLLAQSVQLDVTVLFLSDHGIGPSLDVGFGRAVEYDVDLLSGYRHVFVPNRSWRPGIEKPWGLVNPGLPGVLRALRSEVVLVHGWSAISDWIAFGAARWERIPYLLRGDSGLHNEQAMRPWKRRVKHAVLEPLVRGAAGCLAIGERNRAFYRAYGATPERVHLVPHSVDNERFRQGGELGRAGRTARLCALDLDPGLPVVLFAGKLQRRKRPMDVIEAVGRLERPVNLLIIGEGELRPALERSAASLPRTRLLGFVNQMEIAEWYGLSDVFVLPAEREPWGLAVNEAMAAGSVPVVSAEVGCAPDLVEGGAGRVVGLADIDGLAAAIGSLLDEPTRAAARAEGARRLERYSMHAAVAGIERVVVGL